LAFLPALASTDVKLKKKTIDRDTKLVPSKQQIQKLSKTTFVVDSKNAADCVCQNKRKTQKFKLNTKP
jgi:hypothetical protein